MQAFKPEEFHFISSEIKMQKTCKKCNGYSYAQKILYQVTLLLLF
jgi:hypothetical protein